MVVSMLLVSGRLDGGHAPVLGDGAAVFEENVNEPAGGLVVVRWTMDTAVALMAVSVVGLA